MNIVPIQLKWIQCADMHLNLLIAELDTNLDQCQKCYNVLVQNTIGAHFTEQNIALGLNLRICIYSPADLWKSMFCCYYEVFLWIPHLWAVLNENQPGASLAPSRNFFMTKNQNGRHPQTIISILGNISTFKPLRDKFLVSNTRFSGPRNPFMV